MKKFFSKTITKYQVANMLSFVALFCATFAANRWCVYIGHQEKQIDEVKELRKF